MKISRGGKLFRKITILYLFLLAAAINAQEVKLTFTELLVMGNDPKQPKEYQFAYFYKIKVDSKNNIYIQDYQEGRGGNIDMIKKYSPGGKYITTIGRIGEGPGEFYRIQDFTITNNDNVLIVDDLRQRMTLYDNANNRFKVLGSIPPPVNSPELFSYKQNKMLVLDNTDKKPNKNYLYIKSYDWKTNYSDFGHPSLFVNSGDPLFESKTSYSSSPLSLCVINENTIVAAPSFYDGELTMLTNTNGEWKGVRFSGFKPKYPSFERIERKEFSDIDYTNEPHVGGGTSSQFSYAYIQHAESNNIFTYKGKYILHFFSVCKHPSSVVHYLDIFDMNGKYLGNKVMFERFSSAKNKGVKQIRFLCKDKDENFYIVETTDRIPVLKKIKLDIEIK